jgi:hypothetical protein
MRNRRHRAWEWSDHTPMDKRADLHDQLVLFLAQEHRGGFLLADPVEVCTISFWEHLADFVASQDCERCHQLETRIAHLNRAVANCQRWLRWLLRYRGGRRHE